MKNAYNFDYVLTHCPLYLCPASRYVYFDLFQQPRNHYAQCQIPNYAMPTADEFITQPRVWYIHILACNSAYIQTETFNFTSPGKPLLRISIFVPTTDVVIVNLTTSPHATASLLLQSAVMKPRHRQCSYIFAHFS